MTKFKDKIVLITGAASGIGKLMGRYSLERGAEKVIVWDINTEALEALAEDKMFSGKLIIYAVDVTNTTQVDLAALDLIGSGVVPDILINNAGVVVGKYFNDHEYGEIDLTIDINLKGPMFVTLAFINEMMKKKESHLVNIASAAGMLSNPRMSVYAASKWAVIGWSESVRLEQQKMKTGMRVTTVTPSYIDTGMFKGVKMNKLIPILKPEKAAKTIVEGIENNKIFIRMPAIVKTIPFLKGIAPVRLFDTVASALGVYSSMDKFEGRNKQK
jgi:short-subunit dehydrogenase